MEFIKTLWADARFRAMLVTIVVAVSGYVSAVLSGAPVPSP